MFSNNLISKAARYLGIILVILALIFILLAIVVLPFLSAIGYEVSPASLGLLLAAFQIFLIGIVVLVLHQILEYLIVVEDHLKQQRRSREQSQEQPDELQDKK